MQVNLVKCVFPLCHKTFPCFFGLCFPVGWLRDCSVKSRRVPLPTPPGLGQSCLHLVFMYAEAGMYRGASMAFPAAVYSTPWKLWHCLWLQVQGTVHASLTAMGWSGDALCWMQGLPQEVRQCWGMAQSVFSAVLLRLHHLIKGAFD